MNHIEQMVHWFKARRGQATLAEIIRCGEPWAYEFRARATDARKRGYDFVLQRGKRPSENLYRLVEPTTGQIDLFQVPRRSMAGH